MHRKHAPSDLPPSPGVSPADELRAVFNDSTAPVPARIDAARELILLLERSMAEVRDGIQAMVAAEQPDEDLTATLYWEYDDLVPVRLLGSYHDLREQLEARCPWTYPCPTCGVDLPLSSRNALKTLRTLTKASHAPDSYHFEPFRCPTCREATRSVQVAEVRARYAEYRHRLHELKTMPYREYLRTPEWQQRRNARLKAARYACQVCNTKKKRLNVHHRTYVRRGEEYAQDLVVLCEDCHHLFHRNGSLAPHDEGEA